MMKHIQLLTMDSYLEAKKEVVENAGYKLEELYIDHTKRVKEIIEEIYEEYFEKKDDSKQENSVWVTFKKDKGYYEVGIIDKDYIFKENFLSHLKNEYGQLILEKRELEIVDGIKRVLTTVFIVSSRWSDDVINMVYRIIKYTLSREERDNYWLFGKFIEELYCKDDDEVIFPFEIEDATLPVYCKDMQCILFDVHRRRFIKSNKDMLSLDITKFSFYSLNRIVGAVTERLKNDIDYKEDSKSYDKGYIEGREDYLLLDEILGISLTNIIYWKTRGIKEREVQDNIIEIVSYLAKCHSFTGRNAVAQVLFDYLEATDYNANVIKEIRKCLRKEIKVWNEYYGEIEAVSLCALFNYLKECSESDLVKVCKDIQHNVRTEYVYMREIAEDNEMIKVTKIGGHEKEDKIRIPKKSMNNRTWYAYIHKTIFKAIWD